MVKKKPPAPPPDWRLLAQTRHYRDRCTGLTIETQEKVVNMSRKGGCGSAVQCKLRQSRQGATMLGPLTLLAPAS